MSAPYFITERGSDILKDAGIGSAEAIARCAPVMSSNILVCLLKLHALTFNRPLATITRAWIEGVTFGDTSEAIELLCQVKGWLERCGDERFRITEAGVLAARSIISLAGGLK